MKEKDFILPEYWYLEITDDNRNIINHWRKNIIKYSDTDCQYKYINNFGRGVGSFFLITFEQFKSHVLKEPVLEIINDENYSYLIDLFKKLNIK